MAVTELLFKQPGSSGARRRRLSQTLALVIGIGCGVFTVGAQTSGIVSSGAERLAVVPFVNTTDVEQWDNLADAMSETIQLTLQLGGRYDIVVPPADAVAGLDPYAAGGPADLSRLAESLRLDAAVIGRISSLANGRIELETSVWSNATGTIVGSERREAFGAFDIIDTADELVVLATSALLGYQVDFGAAILRPSRDDVDYRLTIDGYHIGNRVSSVPQILTGVRRFDVTVTVAGREQLVYSAERTVRPGEAIEVVFGLPQVTRRERQGIRTRHELARNLLGQPDQYRVAFEALSESRSLLADARDNAALEPLRTEQQRLETVWQLDEEFARIDPAAVLAPDDGRPTAEGLLPGTTRIAADPGRADTMSEEVARRIARNGAAQYYLLRLAWLQALDDARWEDADAILGEMETVVDTFSLDGVRGAFAADRSSYRTAREEGAQAAVRARRPWPYLGILLGLGGGGYGGYLLYNDEVGRLTAEADERYDAYQATSDPAEAERLRQESEDLYDEAELFEWIQWGSIAAGGLLTVVSAAVLVRNFRAGETYLRDWTRETYGRDIALASDAVDVLLDPPGETEARVVVLGPSRVIASRDGNPVSLPMTVTQPPGSPVDVGRPSVVPVDRTRLYGVGTWLAVVE